MPVRARARSDPLSPAGHRCGRDFLRYLERGFLCGGTDISECRYFCGIRVALGDAVWVKDFQSIVPRASLAEDFCYS